MLLTEIRTKTTSYAAWKNKNCREADSNLEEEIRVSSEKVAEGDVASNYTLKSKEADLMNLRKTKWTSL